MKIPICHRALMDRIRYGLRKEGKKIRMKHWQSKNDELMDYYIVDDAGLIETFPKEQFENWAVSAGFMASWEHLER
jgi:hypothetical protein